MSRNLALPAFLALCVVASGAAFLAAETAEASDPAPFFTTTRYVQPALSGYGIDEVAFVSGERFDRLTRDICEYMAAGVGESTTMTVNGRELPVGHAAASACIDGGDNVVVIGANR